MAFSGHISWQQKQEMHPLRLMTAFRSTTSMICLGQDSAQRPQPTHFSATITG